MSYKLYVESHLSTRLLCSLSGLLIPVCTSNIKFPWSEYLKGSKNPKCDFLICVEKHICCAV